MSSRASGGTFAAFLITAAIVGFAGGAFFGTQAGADEPNGSPSITDTGTNEPPPTETDGGGETPPGESGLTLTVGQPEVAANERIDLSGTLTPPEEGIVLVVQRSVDGGDFGPFADITAETDAEGAFSTWVQTGQAGENSFRVVRQDDENVASEPVVVTVS